jgi:hypothetical protein
MWSYGVAQWSMETIKQKDEDRLKLHLISSLCKLSKLSTKTKNETKRWKISCGGLTLKPLAKDWAQW